jgi:hypothetical protein
LSYPREFKEREEMFIHIWYKEQSTPSKEISTTGVRVGRYDKATCQMRSHKDEQHPMCLVLGAKGASDFSAIEMEKIDMFWVEED